MFNVYKNQLSRQTGSRNLMDPKMLPTIWYTYMTLVTKISDFCHQQYDEKYLGRTDRGKTVYPPPPSGSGGIKKNCLWWPCLLTDWDKMSNLYKRTFHRCFLPSFGSFGHAFQRRFLKIDQSETRIACGGHVC